ncbi:MAG: VanZ family protein [bacterium]|nr:VanZ family protein [bacterium]
MAGPRHRYDRPSVRAGRLRAGTPTRPETHLAAAPVQVSQQSDHAGASPWVALTVIALVLAGSLSPFSFDLAAARANGEVGFTGLGWPPSNRADLLTNVMVYIPVGLALAMTLRRRLGRAAGIATAALIGGAVSLSAEWAQTLLPIRTASWFDVGVNVGGTLLGALAAPIVGAVVGHGFARLRRGLVDRPMTTLAAALAVVLLFLGVAPFDFVSTTDGLHESMVRSRWLVTAVGGIDGTPGSAVAFLSALGAAGAFAAFGFLLALGYRESRCPRRASLELAIVQGAVLALLIEVMQFFVVSRSFDQFQALLEIIGAALGAYLAIRVVDAPSGSAWRERPGLVFRPVLLAGAAAIQIGFYLLLTLGEVISSSSTRQAVRVIWVPFSAYYGRSLLDVAAHFLSVGVASGVLALTVALLIRRLGRGGGRWYALIAVLVVAAFGEGAQVFSTTHVADVTELLLATAAAAFALAAFRRVWPSRTERLDRTALAPVAVRR